MLFKGSAQTSPLGHLVWIDRSRDGLADGSSFSGLTKRSMAWKKLSRCSFPRAPVTRGLGASCVRTPVVVLFSKGAPTLVLFLHPFVGLCRNAAFLLKILGYAGDDSFEPWSHVHTEAAERASIGRERRGGSSVALGAYGRGDSSRHS